MHLREGYACTAAYLCCIGLAGNRCNSSDQCWFDICRPHRTCTDLLHIVRRSAHFDSNLANITAMEHEINCKMFAAKMNLKLLRRNTTNTYCSRQRRASVCSVQAHRPGSQTDTRKCQHRYTDSKMTNQVMQGS